MHGDLKRQRGVTAFGIVMALLLVGIVTSFTLRVAPVYIEHFNVLASMKALKQGDESLQATAVKNALLNSFAINDVKNVDRHHILIERHGKVRVVTVAYEVRKTLVANIDFVIKFSDSVEF